ncbi:MAG: hypothetical protein MUE60_11345, partial [Candidatus Eisenbacteria bacterium]|nr:hypothetical protein [Candidatus Eisenbacteria bacterium]
MVQWVKCLAYLVLSGVAICVLPSFLSAQTASIGADDAVAGSGSFTRDSGPPDAITDLTAALSIPDVILTWTVPSDDVGVTSFRVYQYAAASGTCTQIAHVLNESAQTYKVHCVCGNPTINFVYDVRAEDAAGNIADPSNLAGEFDYMGQEGPIGPAIVTTPTCLLLLAQA